MQRPPASPLQQLQASMVMLLRSSGAIVPLALRRLWAHRLLYSCALLALTIATAMASLIPMYAEAASLRLLERELAQTEARTGRAPFALLIRFLAADGGVQPWERIQATDDLIRGPGLPYLGLPIEGFVRHARSIPLPLSLPLPDGTTQALGSASLGFLSESDALLQILDGAAPQPRDAVPEVMVARSFANRVGLNVGDQLQLRGQKAILVRVAAIWEPRMASDPSWFYQPDAFENVLLLPEPTFIQTITSEQLSVDQMVWFLRLQQTGLQPAQAAPLQSRLEMLLARGAGTLPGLRLVQGPLELLRSYRQGVTQLLLQLSMLSATPLLLTALFLMLVTGALAQRQQAEIALLKTRGVRDSHILAIDGVTWLLLGGLAVLFGLLLGSRCTMLLGQVRSFLVIGDTADPFRVSWSAQVLLFAGAALLLGLAASLGPTWRATQRTLLDEQQQQSRADHAPLWQRMYLDGLLFGVALYGLLTLPAGLGDAREPLRVLLPLVLTLACALFLLRILPLLLQLSTWLLAHTRSIVWLVVLRTLARQPASYRGVVLLLMVTLSTATVSATLARTMDQELAVAIGYQVGSDTQLIETGEQQQAQEGQTKAPGESRFLFVPVSAHRSVPGIQAAARVGRFPLLLQLGGAAQPSQLIGVDRHDFAEVVRWDDAWSGGQPLAVVLNQLAQTPQAVLISRALAERGVQPGQTINGSVTILNERHALRGKVVGVVDLWPGVYPEDGPFVIANLGAVFEQLGDQYPYDVWIRRDPGLPLAQLMSEVRRLGVLLIDVRDHATLLHEAETNPQRQGLFGMLSLGFGAAALLSMLGFMLMALIGARRRVIELGTLAALGLKQRHVIAAMGLEYLLIIAVGMGCGSLIGSLVAYATIPRLRIGAGPHPGTPAITPTVDLWAAAPVYTLSVAAFAMTILLFLLMVRRLQLTQVIRLGDVPE